MPRTGKYIGNCAACGVLLADFDIVSGRFACPRCGHDKFVEPPPVKVEAPLAIVAPEQAPHY